MKDIQLFQANHLRISFAWYDLWLGVYIDSQNRKLHICLIPTLLLTINY